MKQLFDEVFVINLDEQQERLHKISVHLGQHKISFRRMPGMHRADVTNVSPICEAFCTDGIIGCHASHAACWNAIVENDLNNALILEDDARLTNDAKDILYSALTDLPDQWDILFLGCFSCDNANVFERLLNVNERPGQAIGKHLIIPEIVFGTHAYAVSNTGARKLLKWLSPILYHVDYMINAHKQYLDIYSVFPAIAHQDGSMDSTLATSFPNILNYLCHGISISQNPNDGRDVAWAMSAPLFKLWPTQITFNGWFVVLCLAFKNNWRYTVLYILLDIVVGYIT